MQGTLVYVVTDATGGWDNIIGVFSTKEKAKEKCAHLDECLAADWSDDESDYIIHEEVIK